MAYTEQPAQTHVPRRAAGAIIILTWTHFLNDGMANYLPGILPFILTQRHIPLALAGTLMTALGLGQGLQPLSGWIADRIGGRVLVLGGVALSTLGAALIGLSHPLWLLLTLLLFTGVGNTAFHPQALSLAREQAGRRPGGLMSVFLVGGEVGRSLGPLAAGVVVHRWGLSWIWILAIPLMATYPWIARFVPQPKPRPRTGAAIRLAHHTKPAAALVAYAMVRSGIIAEMVILAPLMWSQHGGSLVIGAALDTVFIGVGIVGNLLGGTLQDRVGQPSVLWGTSILAILLLTAFNTLSGGWEWPVLAVLGVAVFGSFTTTMLIGQDIFRETPALGSGISLGLSNALGAALTFPLTYVAARVGDAAAVWILAVLTVITMPAIRWMPVASFSANVPKRSNQ